MKRFFALVLALAVAVSAFSAAFAASSDADGGAPVTRVEFARLLAAVSPDEGAGADGDAEPVKNPFVDTDDESVVKLYGLGIVSGDSENTFNPDANITREDAAVLLYKVAYLTKKYMGEDPEYDDGADVSAYARMAVYYVSGAGILSDTDNLFNPKGALTADEAKAAVEALDAFVKAEQPKLAADAKEITFDNETFTAPQEFAEDTVIRLVGTSTITCDEDCIASDYSVKVVGDGTLILNTLEHAFNVAGELIIESGNIVVESGDEGLQAGYITINGGTIDINTTDDGINAAGDFEMADYFIHVNGGDITVIAGGDGLDSNGTITVTGGTIYSISLSGDNSAIDASTSTTFLGGSIYYGGYNTDEGLTEDTTQSSITLTGALAEGDIIKVTSDGKTIAETEILADVSSFVVSTPKIQLDGTYEVYKNDEFVGSTALTIALGAEHGFNFGGGMGFGGEGFPGGEMPADWGGQMPADWGAGGGQAPADWGGDGGAGGAGGAVGGGQAPNEGGGAMPN